jgi:hypothetical protein
MAMRKFGTVLNAASVPYLETLFATGIAGRTDDALPAGAAILATCGNGPVKRRYA